MNLRSGARGKIRTIRPYGMWLFIVAVVAAAGYYLSQPLATEYIAHAQVAVTPFTLHQEFYSFDAQHPDGRLALQLTVARRSDGATAQINQNFNLGGSPEGSLRVVKLPDGGEFVIYDDIASFVRSPQPPAWIVAMRKEAILNPPSNCVSPGETLAGYDQIQGNRVAIVDSPPFPGGTKYTAWAAPGMGCQTLESLSEAKQPDGTFGSVGKTKLVSVTMTEPDASLFDVPSNHQAVMPSQALHNEVGHLGEPWNNNLETMARNQDASYLKKASGQWGTPPKQNIFQNLKGTGSAAPH